MSVVTVISNRLPSLVDGHFLLTTVTSYSQRCSENDSENAIIRMEGVDWETLRASDGGLAAHVIVEGKVNSVADRGLAPTVLAADGGAY